MEWEKMKIIESEIAIKNCLNLKKFITIEIFKKYIINNFNSFSFIKLFVCSRDSFNCFIIFFIFYLN